MSIHLKKIIKISLFVVGPLAVFLSFTGARDRSPTDTAFQLITDTAYADDTNPTTTTSCSDNCSDSCSGGGGDSGGGGGDDGT